MQKKKKAEERANAKLELQRAIDEAARLTHENAILVQELNRAQLSTSNGTGFAVPSTLAASVGWPRVLDMGRLEPVVSTPTNQGVAFTHPIVTFGSIPLHACSAQSSAVVALNYL